MTRKGVLICELTDNVYRTNIGVIRAQFSRHVRIDIERTINENSEKMVQIWSQHPEVVRSAVEHVLGKKYADILQREV
ncbi:MAG: hypothetical protein KKI06_03095 [Euryarchaeota archaeon]|nr:hypothetical protein [Euryarchaeota archaeon]MCG2735921.1 hypothetical protein [Candidatus Methanoperedenaceae archaeon]